MAANSIPLGVRALRWYRDGTCPEETGRVGEGASAGGDLVGEDSFTSSEPDPPAGGRGFVPDPLISECDGKVVFAEIALMASAHQRELARLEYEHGIQETLLTAAMRWREVESRYLPEEICQAEEIHYGQATLREEERLCRKIACERRRKDPDLFELDRLDSRLHEVRPLAEEVRCKIGLVGERVLELVKILKRIKKVDRKAKGWKLKALRQIACGLFGSLWHSEKCGRKFFRRFCCRNRYCSRCGPRVHDELVRKYLRLEEPIKQFLAAHPLYRLHILDITVKHSDRMPSADDVRKFKADVKELIHRANRYIAEKFGLSFSRQLTGYLYCCEFGFGNSNLHCHGVLLSPYIEQAWLSEQWRQIRDDGSFRVWIAEARSFEEALKHALEYTGKFAVSSPERAFELELAFEGCRRVDGLGWFFSRLPEEDEESCDVRCPCGDPECFVKRDENSGWVPVSWFEERGIRDLDEVRARGSPRKWKFAQYVDELKKRRTA